MVGLSMFRKTKVHVSREQSKIAFFVSIGMLLFGVGFLFQVIQSGVFPGIFFMILWFGVGISIAVTHYRNAFSEKRPPIYEIVEEQTPAEIVEKSDFDTKLRKLEQLYRDRLISEEEYQRKRKEILEQKW